MDLLDEHVNNWQKRGWVGGGRTGHIVPNSVTGTSWTLKCVQHWTCCTNSFIIELNHSWCKVQFWRKNLKNHFDSKLLNGNHCVCDHWEAHLYLMNKNKRAHIYTMYLLIIMVMQYIIVFCYYFFIGGRWWRGNFFCIFLKGNFKG